MVVEEIKTLEGAPIRSHTKPVSQFKNKPLKGLWHKHFFSARFVAHNISNQLIGGRLKALVEEIFDPVKSTVVTADMINELTHRATVRAFESRDSQAKLTGEWIVYKRSTPPSKNFLHTWVSLIFFGG